MGQPHTYTAIAKEETEVLVLEREIFRKVVGAHRKALRRVAHTLFQRQLPRRIPAWSSVRQETPAGEVTYILKDKDRGAYFIEYKSFAMDQVIDLVEELKTAGFVETQGPYEALIGLVRVPWHIRLGKVARRILEWRVTFHGFDPLLTALYRGGGWMAYSRRGAVVSGRPLGHGWRTVYMALGDGADAPGAGGPGLGLARPARLRPGPCAGRGSTGHTRKNRTQAW